METDNTKTNDRIYAKGTKRSFPQVSKRTVYSLQDIKKGDQAGTTDTDTKTDKSDNYKGYTDIYKKHG
jgi:hypothetical protein